MQKNTIDLMQPKRHQAEDPLFCDPADCLSGLVLPRCTVFINYQSLNIKTDHL
jgi:hypothetical protein